MMMNGMNLTSRLLAAMTMRVRNGSSAPRPANSVAKVGMTFHRITVTTRPAMVMMATG